MNTDTAQIKRFHSWELHSDKEAIKKTDKSVFLHHGTAIPQELYDFFNITHMVEGARRTVSLVHSSGTYSADFTFTNNRVRLFWKHDFTDLIHASFSGVYSEYLEGGESNSSPGIKFENSPGDISSYLIEFIGQEEENTEKRQRNPKWVRDELILALDLYFREPATHGNASHPAVVELSNILNTLPLHKGRKLNEKYRNPNGVGMKLANFRTFDPDYDKGLSSSSRLDREVWDCFSDDRERLYTIAEAIKANCSQIPSADELEDDDVEAEEGRILSRMHQKRERNKQLIKKKKQQVLNKLGKLECEVCGFNFELIYGEHGKGFIECHHKKPVSEIKIRETTKLSDLAIVCANCHRMIHKSRPWLSLDEVKSMLAPFGTDQEKQ
ncbi:HNH endonuclease [Desulfogranum marinum]|uniref:HNH endonuclease n=1 Tax=Desulfogranum marinum TaxID=453220 RepID=UPI0029C68C7C|nr:HNH endonuclease [Desulfogranum marinum]